MGVPKQLADELIEAGEELGNDLPALFYKMAFRIIRFYLGDKWATQKVRLQHEFDPFMLNEFDEGSDNRFTHMTNVLELGHALFNLRDCRNFHALCERFNNRDTKSCFTEAQIASSFIDAGFSVEIVRETGTRGADFDFVACRSSQNISVEVTAKEAAVLTASTIKNTLTSKRNQVPADRAAILYIIIPEEWTADARLAESIFPQVIGDFFRGTRRFNAVVLVWEATFVLGEGKAFALAYRPYENPAPRHPIGDTSFLTPVHPNGDLNTYRRRVDTYNAGLRTEMEKGIREPPPSFYVWYRAVRQ